MRRLPLVVLLAAATSPAVRAQAPAPRVEPARAPEVWAVVVGIERYDDPEVPACHGTARDARAIAGWVAETAGWGHSHVLLMDDRGAARPPDSPRARVADLRPTRANLDWAMTKWLGA